MECHKVLVLIQETVTKSNSGLYKQCLETLLVLCILMLFCRGLFIGVTGVRSWSLLMMAAGCEKRPLGGSQSVFHISAHEKSFFMP